MLNINVKCVCWLLLISLIHNATSIKCFSCRSNDDPKCGDPFDNSTIAITDCDQENRKAGERPATMCRKIRQKVDGEWRYIRGCANLREVEIQGDESFCLMGTGVYNNFIEYCTCGSKDGCNSSAVFSPVPLLILFSLMSLIYKYGNSN